MLTTEQFERTATTMRPMLLNYAKRKLKSAAIAEEMVQDVMLTVWEAVQDGSFDGDCLEAWMFQTIKSRVLNQLTHETMAQRVIADNAPVTEDEDGSGMAPAEHLDGRVWDLQLDVHKAIDLLGENAKLARAHFIEGCTAKELAERYGLTHYAVTGRLERCRLRLKELLSEYRDESRVSLV